MKATLTETRIQSAKAKDKAYVIWDLATRGFGVRVFPSGVKSYMIVHCQGKKNKWVVLGKVEQFTLKDARILALKELAKMHLGEDDLVTKRKAEREAVTFAEFWNQYLNEYVPERMALGRMAKKTLSDYSKVAKLYLLPVLGNLKVKDITRTHIEKVAKQAKKVSNTTEQGLSCDFQIDEPCRRVGVTASTYKPCPWHC